MPSRARASARRSPTPLRNLTGVSSWMPGTERWRPSGRSVLEQGLGKSLRIKRLKIVRALPGADEPDRKPQLAPQCRHGSATRTAVELGDDDTGQRHGLGKEAPLLNGVLSYRAGAIAQLEIW